MLTGAHTITEVAFTKTKIVGYHVAVWPSFGVFANIKYITNPFNASDEDHPYESI